MLGARGAARPPAGAGYSARMRRPQSRPERGVFCNRTLDLSAISAVGYDMDYTLVHYASERWEAEAYRFVLEELVAAGWPVGHLEFQPARVRRGLILDLELGNLLKANRFGLVERAVHGNTELDGAALRAAYAHTVVRLAEPRWVFLNTLFSLSEGCIYTQLVDELDQRRLPGVLDYDRLYRQLSAATDAAHTEGRLKARILAAPDTYIELDPEVPLTLLDQRYAGKKLLLITNSDWAYTNPVMAHAFDRFLPRGARWRDLFDVIVVSARKPAFFTDNAPFYEVVTDDGLMRPGRGRLEPAAVYVGGSARQLERHLGVSGDEILYVGDHMFGDVHVTKNVLRWRTALILREIEAEVLAWPVGNDDEQRLDTIARQRDAIDAAANRLRTLLQRRRVGYGPEVSEPEADMLARVDALSVEAARLEDELALFSEEPADAWGPMMRSGRDKSHLAFQVERYADVYTSRVSNLLHASPYARFRSLRITLPHDVASRG